MGNGGYFIKLANRRQSVKLRYFERTVPGIYADLHGIVKHVH
jgi:hypothetical protein